MKHHIPFHALLLAGFAFAAFAGLASAADAPVPAAAPAAETAAAVEARRAEEAAAVAEAQQGLDEAIRAMEEARAQIAVAQAGNDEELLQLREELSRAHRALREASREVARAHRELARADHGYVDHLRMVNLGDRAVIGVLLGEADTNGVRLAGVSPDGPAERAGLRTGDVLVSIRGTDLTGQPGAAAREALFDEMDKAEDGEEIAIGVVRDGHRWDFTVKAEKREPASWQSLLALAPPPPGAPGAPLAPEALPFVMLDRIEVPEFDAEELQRKVDQIEDQLEQFEYGFVDEDGNTVKFRRGIEIDGAAMSGLADHALSQANVWFGLPHMRGLELVPLNPALGRYFKADRGVLVVNAADDNVYGLEAGDVILSIAGHEVDRPGDLLRALRDAEPGSEVELEIKREQRSRTLKAAVPENRLGARTMHFVPARPAAPLPPAE